MLTKKVLERHLNEITIPFLKFEGNFADFCWKTNHSTNGCVTGRLGGGIKSDLHLIDSMLGHYNEGRPSLPLWKEHKKEWLDKIKKVLDSLK